MNAPGSRDAQTAPGSPALDERETIRALLLQRRPALAGRMQLGPSGALEIPLPTGRSIEVGRMRRRGRPRWVVVTPSADGARLREPRSLRAAALTVLAELDGQEPGRGVEQARHDC